MFYNQSMKNLILALVVIIGLIVICKIDEPRQKAINKYNCAVWGYKEDCKTPLPFDQRLK